MSKTKKRGILLSLLLVLALSLGGISAYATAPPDEDDILSQSIPELVLLSYEITEGSLVAEQQVTIQFELQNTDELLPLNGITLSFGTDTDGLYPVFGESNILYIPSIAPGESYTTQKRFSISGIAAQLVELPVEMSYTPFGGERRLSEAVVYLPVFGPSSFYSQLDVPSSAYAGTPLLVSGFCNNIGQMDLQDLTINIETVRPGGETTNLVSSVIGRLTADAQVSVSEMYTLDTPDTTQTLSIYFTFTDTQGNLFELPATTYSVSVLDASEQLPTPDTEQTSSEQLSSDEVGYTTLLIGGLIVLISLAIGFILLRRKNRR